MKKKIIIAIVVLIIVGGIIIIVNNNKKNDLKIEDTIDVNDEYYANKTIYKQDGDIIIEGENDSKTIISNKNESKTDLKEADDATKSKYTLSDVKVEPFGAMTKVSGKITNNTGSTHKVSIQTKFYKEDGKVAGTISSKIESLKANETQEFSATLMGDYSACKYKTEVEFTN